MARHVLPRHSRRLLGAGATAAVLAFGVACGGSGGDLTGRSSVDSATPTPTPTSTSTPLPSAKTLAVGFLDNYLDPDGRIVRRDQGGDTVSEGQAYGLQLALVASDRARFDLIWSWTKAHLLQANGLLAWRWSNGAVADEQSAADADVDTATALLLAGSDFADPADTSAGRALAESILRGETVSTADGPVLAAGPWAVTTPAVLNPSYLVAGTADFLAARTGDTTWSAVATATEAEDQRVAPGSSLPPDWAKLAAPAAATQVTPMQVTPSAAPNTGAAPSYGLDAPRLLIRLGASCAASDRSLAAQSTSLLGGIGQPAVRGLDGSAEVSWRHPISDVAVAAVASARGDRVSVRRALASAAAEQAKAPTYYGAAWVALGTAYLTTSELNRC